jgi:hypothetical protein
MAVELDLKALREKVLLRETNAHIVDDKEAAACYRFTLRQIERVEACGCSDGMKDCGCGYHDCNRMVRCPYCTNLRSDLLALQKEVRG